MVTPRNPTLAWQRIGPPLATFAGIVLGVACLYWARPVLIPLALATLFTFMLGPAVAWLQRRGVPRIPSVLSVVALAVIVLAAGLWVAATQLVQLMAELPEYQENVAKRVAEVREQGSGTLLRNVQRFVKEVTAAATQPPNTPPNVAANEPISVKVVERVAITSVASWVHGIQPVAEPILTSGLVIVLVVYLLIFREDLRSRFVALVGRGHLTLTTKALDDAGRRISRYLIAQFSLNLAFGVVIGLGLLVLGVPHALLWGCAAGLLRYIPYVGAWIACSLPIGMSLLISEDWMRPLAVVGLFLVVEFVANLVVEPWLYGQSIGISQAAWMVAIIFWTWLWGAVGLMLATPLTTCLVVLGKHVPGLRFLDILLGDEPALTPDIGVYQRLISRDEDEAAEIVRRQAQAMSPIELCDRVLVPAIVHARKDLHAGLLSAEEYEFVLAAIRSLAEHQDLGGTTVAETRDLPATESEPRAAITVLACPAQDEADVAALRLFQDLLDRRKIAFDVVSAKCLVSEVLERVAARQPAAICIAALPDGGLAHTRHLCKRLRGRFPGQKIVVGRWGDSEPSESVETWTASGADYFGITLNQTMQQLEMLAQVLRPAAEVASGGVTRVDAAAGTGPTSADTGYRSGRNIPTAVAGR